MEEKKENSPNNKNGTRRPDVFGQNIMDEQRSYEESIMQQQQNRNKSADTQNVAVNVSDLNNSLANTHTTDDISVRGNVSKLHVEDIITQPTKLGVYMAYQMSTHGTYENEGLKVAHAVYAPAAIAASNFILKQVSNGAVANYMNSNAFQEVRQALVFDSNGAANELRNVLKRSGITDEGQIGQLLDSVYANDFVPGRDMSQLYRDLDLSKTLNSNTGKIFTPAEIQNLRHELQNVINTHTPNAEGINARILTDFKSKNALKDQQKMINEYLKKHKLAGVKGKGLGNLSGTTSIRQLKNLLKRGDLTAQERAVIKHAIGLHAAMKTKQMSKKKLGVVKQLLRTSKQKIRDTHMGAGINLIIDLTRTAQKTIKYGMKTASFMGHGLKYGISLISRPVRAVGSLANKALRKNPVVNSALNRYVDPVLNRGRDVANNVKSANKARLSRKEQRLTRRNNLKRDIKRFIRDPFRLREKAMRRLGNTAVGKAFHKATAPVRNVVNAVKAVFAKLISAVAAVYSAVMSFLSAILILIGILIVFLFFIEFLVASVMNFFTMNSEKSDDGDVMVIDKCIEKINDLYNTQMNSITAMQNDSKYRNVTVQFNDVKTYESYDTYDTDEEGGDLYAYTNSREILSMAKVYFDFDLSEPSESEVLNYVTQLYNGSHVYSVSEVPVYKQNEDGEMEATGQYDATIVYTTYYFDSLFSCQLSSSGLIGSAYISNYDCIGSDNAEKIWNYFMQAGFSKAGAAGMMGNIMNEAYPAFNPASLEFASISKSGVSSAQFTAMVDSGQISRDEVILSSRFGLYSWPYKSGNKLRYGYGLCGFTDPTIKEYLCMCTIDVGKSIGDLYGQLDSLISYLNKYKPSLIAYLKTTNDVGEAANKFLREYENPGNIDTEEIERRAAAQQIYNRFYDYVAPEVDDDAEE